MKTVSPTFQSACSSRVRHPESRVFFQWDGSNYTEETEYLVSHSGSCSIRLAGPELSGSGEIGSARVILDNASGRFDRFRTTAPLYPYIGGPLGFYGKKAYLQVGFGSEFVTIFTGLIYSWSYEGSNLSLELRDAGFQFLQKKASTPVYTLQRVDEWIEKLAEEAGITAYELDTSSQVIPYVWLDDENPLEEMQAVAEAEGGLVFFDSEGTLRFWGPAHLALQEESQGTFSASQHQALVEVPQPDAIVKKVIVEWSARQLGDIREVYVHRGEKIIPPGETISFRARLDVAVYELEEIGGLDLALVSTGGDDITDQCTVTISEQAAQSCLITIANNSAFPAVVARLVLRGRPLEGGQNDQVEVEVESSPLAFDRDRSLRGNPYLQTLATARSLARLLADRHARLMPAFQLRGIWGWPHLELGDRITVSHAPHFPGEQDAYVTGINWNFAPDGGFRQDLTLILAADLFPHQPYFRIGITALGEHGRAFY
jgi:hypothetical protein